MESVMRRAVAAASDRVEVCSDGTATMMFVGFDVDVEEARQEAYAQALVAVPYAQTVGLLATLMGVWQAGFVTGLHHARVRAEDDRKPSCAVCGSPASALSGRVGDVFACSAQCAQRVIG